MDSTCLNCTRVFKNLSALKRHLLIKKACKIKPLSCSNCARGFACQKSLLTHQRIYCKGKNSTVSMLLNLFKEWIAPFVDLNSPISTWSQQFEKYTQSSSNEIDFIDTEHLRHLFKMYCHCYSLLLNYNSNKRNMLLKLLIKLFRYNKFDDEGFLYLITNI